MRRNGLILLAFAALASPGRVAAQRDPAPNYAGPGTLRLDGITVTGSLRARVYVWDWFEPSSGDNSYIYSGNLARFGFSQVTKRWEWNAEFAAPVLLSLPAYATAPAPQGALGLGSNYYSANNARNAGMVFPKQLYIKWKGSEASLLQLGRFEFNDGTETTPKNAVLATLKNGRISQRLIGAFGWTDVGRSFDGARFSYTRGTHDLTLIAATPTRGVFQVDGWGWNQAAFEYAAYTHAWGKGKHAADTRAFFIEYGDWRPVLKVDNRPSAVRQGDLSNIRLETFGGHSLHAITTTAGTFDILGWLALQTGRWGLQDHRAYAVDFEAGFQPAILPKLKPWIRGGFSASSGDGDTADGTHRTFFQLLPTPRPYARMPFFNMMNLQDSFGSLTLRPHAQLTVSSEFHSLRLANANDLWYSGGGVYQPWTFGYVGRATSGNRSLANLYDISVEYRASKYATFTGYYGYAQGLAVTRQIYPTGKNAMLGYVEALLRF